MEALINDYIKNVLSITTSIHCVGDAMIDEYYDVKISRISPEYPIPVMLCNNKFISKPGGVANVALQFKYLNAKVKLITFPDSHAYNIFKDNSLELLSNDYVEAKLPIKRRFLDNDIQVAPRLDIEFPNCGLHDIEQNLIHNINQKIINNIEKPNVAILSDYDKGFFNNKNYINVYKKLNVKTIVDPKIGNLDKWKYCSIFKPNKNEARILSGFEDWQKQAKYFYRYLKCEAVIITDAGNGIKGIYKNQFFEYNPQVETNVKSVIGAGDCFASYLASAFALGYNPLDAAKIAYHAGLIYVTKSANSPVSLLELANTKLVNPELLRYRDFKLVFTNGCFDILHPGHIETLKFAKSKGDKLVLALNSDSSIKKIKGDSRPILNLSDRIKILSSIDCVDYIVSFEEETPFELINIICPDVLVKGGDYNHTNLVGSNLVNEVYFSEYVSGNSSTNLINKLNKILL